MEGGILSKFFGTSVPTIPEIKIDEADLPDRPVQEDNKKQQIPGETKWSGFDSTGLERAVICIRELNKSGWLLFSNKFFYFFAYFGLVFYKSFKSLIRINFCQNS